MLILERGHKENSIKNATGEKVRWMNQARILVCARTTDSVRLGKIERGTETNLKLNLQILHWWIAWWTLSLAVWPEKQSFLRYNYPSLSLSLSLSRHPEVILCYRFGGFNTKWEAIFMGGRGGLPLGIMRALAISCNKRCVY